MDNLAHSLVAVAVGAALAPKLIKNHKKKLFFASIAVANASDIDFLLHFLGQETYFFHHRGFTHSILGLFLMIPIGMLLFRLIMKSGLDSPLEKLYPVKNQIIFVVTQLLFTHFFLDYLTTYGVLFLYPFSWIRFSYPLMFIIDPLLWLLGFISFYFLAIKKIDASKIPKIAYAAIASVFLLWIIEIGFKYNSESIYKEKFPTNKYKLTSYPGPLAPLYWTFVLENDQAFNSHPAYHQASYSYLRKEPNKLVSHPVPKDFLHEKLCDGIVGQNAEDTFIKFQEWAEKSACVKMTYQGQLGCRCSSLKYALAEKPYVGFGSFWINQNGDGIFLPGNFKQQYNDIKNSIF